jgi:hypothetical protein
MNLIHTIKVVYINESNLRLIIDGKQYSFNLSKISKRLLKATQEEKENFNISPSGYGISWPSIDEDLSIDGLLGIKHKPTSRSKVKLI